MPDSLGSGFYFDQAEADRVVEFAEKFLTHQKGELSGKPFIPDQWQIADILAPLFGNKRVADGTRQYRQAICFLPRKQGKSHIAVLIALYCLFCDKEAGAEVYCCASDTSQAEIVFTIARDMVLASPALRKRCKVYRRSIVVPATRSVFRVLSSDAASKHGANASCIVYDEVHAWKSRELYDVLHTSTGARRQPLELVISTAGIYDPHSLAWSLYSYAKGCRDGSIDDPYTLPVIYEAAPDAHFLDRDAWRQANPGLGSSIKEEYIEREAKRAAIEPSYENRFRQLHLGQWPQQVTRWLPIDAWNQCRKDLPDLTGIPCFGGLDLSSTLDISAFVLCFDTSDGPFLLPRFWIPEAKLKNTRDKAPYRQWHRDGHLIATPGDVIDYDFIRQEILALAEQYDIQSIRYDPYNATQLCTQLAEQDGLYMLQHRQGYVSMNAPCKELERRIVSRSIAHPGNPVLDWMVGNVSIRTDPAGNIKPDKSKSTERIDGVVASVMALSGMLAGTERSVYEDRGLISV